MACCGLKPGQILNSTFKGTSIEPRPSAIEGAVITTASPSKDGK